MNIRLAVEAGMLLVICLVTALLIFSVALDAYEFETTGSCRDCIILDKVRDFGG